MRIEAFTSAPDEDYQTVMPPEVAMRLTNDEGFALGLAATMGADHDQNRLRSFQLDAVVLSRRHGAKVAAWRMNVSAEGLAGFLDAVLPSEDE